MAVCGQLCWLKCSSNMTFSNSSYLRTQMLSIIKINICPRNKCACACYVFKLRFSERIRNSFETACQVVHPYY